MQRKLMQRLVRWKNSPGRKPLLIQGARQVGKTWLMKEFGSAYYRAVVYANFDDRRDIQDIFTPNLDTRRIIASLASVYQADIRPEDTLIIFDEIQECNRALISLKYFRENAPQYHIVGAGSFLGVAAHAGNSFPVGKVDMLTLYPMTFSEFLSAIGEDRLAQAAAALDYPFIAGMKNSFIECLKHYFYVGGMPEAVFSFSQTRDFEKAREIQKIIARNYQADFSKHIHSADIPKAGMIWESIPAQLARENSKFLYSGVKPGARAREYENALSWLVASGLVYRINRVSLPNLPLFSYREHEHFKLFMLDVGLLSAKAGLDIKTLLDPNPLVFNHFKGALTEQYVLQELVALDKDLPLFYWTNAKNTCEIDFVVQAGNTVIPLEVKAGVNLKAKSLKFFMEKFGPAIAVRSSLADFGRHEKILELPLYIVGQFPFIINSIG
jgi:predicted AAA+ superfamily ATPase